MTKTPFFGTNALDILFYVALIASIIIVVGGSGSYYYPTEHKTITIERSVDDTNQYAVVTTDGTYYNTDFKLYVIIESGHTYNATISHPWFADLKILEVEPVEEV